MTVSSDGLRVPANAVGSFSTNHDGALHLIVDSTGLKISGAGEWHAYRRKRSKARRQWRKLHVGVDDDGFIVAAKLTRAARTIRQRYLAICIKDGELKS